MTTSTVVNNKPPTDISTIKELQKQLLHIKIEHKEEINQLNNELSFLKEKLDTQSLNEKTICKLRFNLLQSQQEMESLLVSQELKFQQMSNNFTNDRKQLSQKYEQEIHHQRSVIEAANAEITQQQLIITDLTQLCQTNNYNYMSLTSFRNMSSTNISSNINETSNIAQYPKPDKLQKMIRETSARMLNNISDDLHHQQQRNSNVFEIIVSENSATKKSEKDCMENEPFFITAAIFNNEKNKSLNQKPEKKDYKRKRSTGNIKNASLKLDGTLVDGRMSDKPQEIDWENDILLIDDVCDGNTSESDTKDDNDDGIGDSREFHTQQQSNDVHLKRIQELEQKNQQLMLEARHTCQEICVFQQKMEQMKKVFDEDYQNYSFDKQRMQLKIHEQSVIIDEMNKSHSKVRKISIQSTDDICSLYKQLREKESVIKQQTMSLGSIQSKIQVLEKLEMENLEKDENEVKLRKEMKELQNINRRNSIVIEEYAEKKEQTMNEMQMEIVGYKERMRMVREKNALLSKELRVKEEVYEERVECSDIAYQQMLNIVTQSTSMTIKTLNEENDNFRMEIRRMIDRNKVLTVEFDLSLQSKMSLIQSFNHEMDRIRDCMRH